MRAAVIDYGAGNLSSVEKALGHVGFRTRRVDKPAALDGTEEVLVLPGVGHFSATAALVQWRPTVLAHVSRDRPLLGICLGLQWLFEGSDEAPGVPGLGLLHGRCFRLRGGVKVPHVGWNTIEPKGERALLAGVGRAHVYFTHSYAAPVTEACAAVTTYGLPFASAVERGRVFATQWHPEKSGEPGLRLLRNLADVVQSC